ncbi:hypothetical protein FACS1894139_18220 [Planctomycetales bacterium]|nr:hypothetical protein FACS1894107_07760 [Planctomycetales bacterium]GHT08489.1 hypothetical protein FACS1894139_18220 [Planctomycetales bacterium]GHV18487.1 hypothetical protein AGMMS49959_00370 [Planctomycetales bacterium]
MIADLKSETALRVEAMRILIEQLGEINAERFVNSIKSDPFDYTEWQRTLWSDKSLTEIFQAAREFRETKKTRETGTVL